jgi:hypothetical protein
MDNATLRKQAFDMIAGVMLNSGNEAKVWTNGFDPDISEMLATNVGGFFSTEYATA